jgi:hypothetical protein
MDFDFETFLRESEISCRTKTDFVKRIIDEVEAVTKIKDEQSPLERELYLRRLNNAKFCIEKGAMKDKDKYNSDLLELLDRLK